MRRLLLFTLTALLALPALAHADTRGTIASLPGESPVKEWAGQVLYSKQDAADGPYRLVLQTTDGREQVLDVPAQKGRFDADIGPGPDGQALVVLSRCGETRATEDDCDLWQVRPGSAATPIAAANTPEHAETSPTIWRTQLAFARDDTVYTRGLDSARSVRSTRRPGVPSKRCSELVDAPKGANACLTRGRSVDELELYGNNLALIVSYYVKNQAGHGTVEVRYDDLRKRNHSDRVALQTYGEGGQSLLGLSFAGSRLGWTKSCYGDPGGCTVHGPYRYSLTGRTYQYAVGPYRGLSGFALTSTGSVEVDGREELGDGCDVYVPGQGAPQKSTCLVQRVSDTTWRAIEAKRIRH